MTCSAASTLKPQATAPLLPVQLPTNQGDWQRVRTAFQQLLRMVQGAAGATGVNVVPQQYALVAGATLPPIASLSNCTVVIDTGTVLFGSGSYKISITGSPATIEFSADTAWPLSAGWQWIVSFFQQASAAFAGSITITTPKGTYTTAFTTTLTAQGFERLFDTLNLGADTSTSFGLSFTFTGGTGQTVWLDGLMMEPYFNVAMQPSPFISTSGALTVDNQPDGFTFVKLLGSHASGNVAYNFRGVWSSATGYVISDEVVYGSTYWLALAPSTNSAPSVTNANWQAVGTYGAFEGAWSSITAYTAGAEVTYAGNFWICVTGNTNSAPSTSNANWVIAGPESLDDVSDGATYARTLASGLTSGQVNTNGLVTEAVTNYAIVVDASNSTSFPYTTTTVDYDMESVSNVTAGGAVEVDVSAYVSIGVSVGMAINPSTSNLSIYRNGSFVGTIQIPVAANNASPFIQFVSFSILDTPAAGSHTYTFHAHLSVSGGSGTDKTTLAWTPASLKMREFKR